MKSNRQSPLLLKVFALRYLPKLIKPLEEIPMKQLLLLPARVVIVLLCLSKFVA